MGRVYGEPVEVQTGENGYPVVFAWRKRRYTVIAVQEYWMVNRDWWRESAPVPARPELEFWRLEAAADSGHRVVPSGATGSYELRRDIAAGSWTLRRVAD